MLPRRRCDAPSASKNEKPLLSVALYHQYILFAAAAAVWVMCACVCVLICRVLSPLRHLHFQNVHKEHARSVKGNVEATRFITVWLRIHMLGGEPRPACLCAFNTSCFCLRYYLLVLAVELLPQQEGSAVPAGLERLRVSRRSNFVQVYLF